MTLKIYPETPLEICYDSLNGDWFITVLEFYLFPHFSDSFIYFCMGKNMLVHYTIARCPLEFNYGVNISVACQCNTRPAGLCVNHVLEFQ